MKPSKVSNGNAPVISNVRNFLDNFWNADPFFSEDFFNMRKRSLTAVNIKDKNGNFEIDVAAPGFSKKDFDVKVENGTLCISALTKENKEEKEDNYTRREFSYSSFERSFSLPENADTKNIDAKYKDGVLKLVVKKTKTKTPAVKKIAIK